MCDEIVTTHLEKVEGVMRFLGTNAPSLTLPRFAREGIVCDSLPCAKRGGGLGRGTIELMPGEPLSARLFGHSIDEIVTVRRMNYRITHYKETNDEQHE